MSMQSCRCNCCMERERRDLLDPTWLELRLKDLDGKRARNLSEESTIVVNRADYDLLRTKLTVKESDVINLQSQLAAANKDCIRLQEIIVAKDEGLQNAFKQNDKTAADLVSVNIELGKVQSRLAAKDAVISDQKSYLDMNAETIAKLLVQSKELKQENQRFKSALEFYAHPKIVTPIEFTHPDMEDENDPEIGHFTIPDDFEFIETELSFISGKHARQALSGGEG